MKISGRDIERIARGEDVRTPDVPKTRIIEFNAEALTLLIHGMHCVMKERAGSMLAQDIDLHHRANAMMARLHREKMEILK